jgi:RNA polymerase sigma-B factor
VSTPETTDARLSLLQRPPTQRHLGSDLLAGGTSMNHARITEARVADGRVAESRETDARAVDSRTTADRTTTDRTTADRTAGDRAEDQATEARATEARATEARTPDSRTTQDRGAQSRTTDDRSGPADNPTTGNRSTERPPTDSRTAEKEVSGSDGPPSRERRSVETESTSSRRAGSAATDPPAPREPEQDGPRVDHRLVALARMSSADPRYGSLRRSVIEAHLPLVHHLAQRFRGRGEPYDDLVQVGTIGLLHSVDRYDPGRGSFAAFAVPTIVGEIRRHFRDRGWAMRIPRRVQDLGRRVSEAREVLTHSLDRSPTVQEIANHLEVDADLILEALETASAYITVPLPTTADESDRMAKAFEDSGLELVEQRETLRPLLARLPAREQRILELRFSRGMSQSQIASEVGVSQMHVSRLLTKSLAALRSGLTEEL